MCYPVCSLYIGKNTAFHWLFTSHFVAPFGELFRLCWPFTHVALFILHVTSFLLLSLSCVRCYYHFRLDDRLCMLRQAVYIAALHCTFYCCICTAIQISTSLSIFDFKIDFLNTNGATLHYAAFYILWLYQHYIVVYSLLYSHPSIHPYDLFILSHDLISISGTPYVHHTATLHCARAWFYIAYTIVYLLPLQFKF
jgi:hypothetical protein